MEHIGCGGPLKQIPNLNAYSCLRCGTLLGGNVQHTSGPVVVAPPTREVPE